LKSTVIEILLFCGYASSGNGLFDYYFRKVVSLFRLNTTFSKGLKEQSELIFFIFNRH